MFVRPVTPNSEAQNSPASTASTLSNASSKQDVSLASAAPTHLVAVVAHDTKLSETLTLINQLIENNEIEAIKAALDNLVDVDIDLLLRAKISSSSEDIIDKAIIKGSQEIIALLIDRANDPKAKFKEKFEQRKLQLMALEELIVKYSARPALDEQDLVREVHSIEAAIGNHDNAKVASILYNSGNVDTLLGVTRDGENLVYAAVMNNDDQAARALLEKATDPMAVALETMHEMKKKIETLETPLTPQAMFEKIASMIDNSEMSSKQPIEELSKCQDLQAVLACVDSGGKSLYEYAAEVGDGEILEYLLEKSADPQAALKRPTSECHSLLHMVLYNYDEGTADSALVEVILKRSTNYLELYELADSNEKTPPHLFDDIEDEVLDKILESYPSKEQLIDKEFTELVSLIESENYNFEAVQQRFNNFKYKKELLEKTNDVGETIYYRAARMNKQECVDLFLAHLPEPQQEFFKITELLRTGAEIADMIAIVDQTKDITALLAITSKEEGNLLLQAVDYKAPKLLAAVLAKAVDKQAAIIAATLDGEPLLNHIVASAHSEDMAKNVLENATDKQALLLDGTDSIQPTIHRAVRGFKADVVGLLLDNASDLPAVLTSVDTTGDKLPLIKQNPKMVALLIDRAPDGKTLATLLEQYSGKTLTNLWNEGTQDIGVLRAATKISIEKGVNSWTNFATVAWNIVDMAFKEIRCEEYEQQGSFVAALGDIRRAATNERA
ncbi:MAG: hypothetical protein ACHP6I_01045 [Rickettsiales bacterium]